MRLTGSADELRPTREKRLKTEYLAAGFKSGHPVRPTPIFLPAAAVLLTSSLAAQGARRNLPTTIREEDRRDVPLIVAASPPRIDGVLDEAMWESGAAITGFTQAEPDEGLPATERTEVWVAADGSAIYVAAYLHDSDPGGIIINDIRRDFQAAAQDAFQVIFDTFGDRRNGYMFATNPAGARADEQVTNEGRETNASWDAPWSVSSRIVPDGWTTEMRIPRSALRTAVEAPLWGINFSRVIRRKNEVVYWAPIPRAYALTRLSLAANLTGLAGTGGGRDLRITPYVLGRTVRDVGGSSFEEKGDVGGDLKMSVTNGLTLDLTVNPDFAQAEADVQQVNLTQFSQFYPEKRDFFLENSGLFYIGDTPRNTRVSTAPRGDEDLLVFFSRRMGLASDGTPIPIDGGLRLTGQEGRTQVGALALRTRGSETTAAEDFGVVRLRQNVGNNSDIGLLGMARSEVDDRGNYNYVWGGDANLRLPADIDWQSFIINSETPGVTGGSRYAFQTTLNREANFVHLKYSLLSIGENFNDELGFVRRTGIRKWHTDMGIRPRFRKLRELGIREMHPHIVWNYITNLSNDELAYRLHSGWTFFLNNGGFMELSANPAKETLVSDLTIHSDADPVPAGPHSWVEWMLRGTTNPSAPFGLDVAGIVGGLWTGTQKTVRVTGTWRPGYHFSGSMAISRTDADLGGANGQFVREIVTGRANYSFTPNMFVDGLAQWDPDQDLLNLNVRFNFIHAPLSDLFVVYNEQRFTYDGSPAPGRSVIVKFTRMLAP